MELYILVPLFSSTLEAAKRREQSFRQWYRHHRRSLTDKFGIKDIQPIPLKPGHQIVFPYRLTIIYPETETGQVPKGLAIRLQLISILRWIDVRSPAYRSDAYFIMIDGSGAISFDNIDLVLNKLIIEQSPIVLGRRPDSDPTWFMGNVERRKIEVFEKYLLECKYRKVLETRYSGGLPDAQAGCWGMRLDIAKDISLTAEGYELEFDLVASSLAANILFTFTEELKQGDRIGGSGISDYGPSIRKLDFILHKLGWSKEDLRGCLEKYLQQFQADAVPGDYLRLVQHFIISPPGAADVF